MALVMPICAVIQFSTDRIGADARAFRSLQVYAAERRGNRAFGAFDLWGTVSLPAKQGNAEPMRAFASLLELIEPAVR